MDMFSATSCISLDTQPQVYDFKSEENALKWRGIFRESLAKVLSQVHMNLTAREDALDHVESLILQLLMVLSGKPMPHTVQDVEEKVERTFPNPINKWAILEARGVLEKGKKRSVVLPVEKVHTLLVKEVFMHKIDFQVSLYIVAVLEYIAADILNLVGKYKKNIHHVEHHAITTQDIKTAISADQVLIDIFEQDEDMPLFSTQDEEPVPNAKMSYDEAVKEMILEEKQYLRDLNLIIRVFKAQIESFEQTSARDVELIFSNLADVYECTVTVLGQLEDTLEMADDGWHLSVGSCFEELAEESEFDVYERYTTDVMQPQCRDQLSALLDRPEIFNGLGTAGHGFREAVKYMLPKLLLLPVAHVLKYFDNIKMLYQLSESEEDREVLEQVQGMLKTLQTQLERIVSSSGITVLPKRKHGDPPARSNRSARQANIQKMNEVQRSIDGWEGKDISQCGCSEFVKEGQLGKVGSGRKLTERHVFLFDGLIVLCKPNSRRSSVTGPTAEFRLKEKFQIRKVEVKDREDSDDVRFAFEIAPREQSSVILYAKTAQDKNEWMASLIMLNTKSMLDRSLDMILLDEEKKNPLRLPDPDKYRFAEPDSSDNIVLEQPESGGVPLIKGATLTKLTERLTYHMYADPMFVRTFLTTFRSFCTAQELLTLLLERYDIPEPAPPADQSPTPPGHDSKAVKATLRDDIKRFRKEYSQPVKFRVLNVLRHWVDHHFYDFERDQVLLGRLEHFLSEIKGKVMRKCADSILKIISRKRCNREELKPEVVFGVDRSPPPVEWHLYKSEDDWKNTDDLVKPLLMLHPVEVARQLTLLELDLYRAVKPAELVGSVWTKENKQQASPNLLRMIHHNTNVTRWLERCVLDTDNIDERRAVVSRIIEVMMVLQELNNFSGVLEVIAALDSAAIHRLVLTFEEIVPKLDRALEEARELCNDHYKRYQEKLRSINPPCVPFFGMYLTNILHIDEGNPDFLPKSDRLINFSKRRKVAEITGEIQQYQNQPYCLRLVPKIRSFLEGLRPFEEGKGTEEINNYLYTRSLTIEPRGCRVPPKFPRQWDGISLRSPGIKPPGAKPRRPNLPPMRPAPLSGRSIAEEADCDTPRVMTPPTPGTPSSPPHTASSDNSVFANVIVGATSNGTRYGVPPPVSRSPPPPLPPRRSRELSLGDGLTRVQQAPDAPQLPPRNTSPPPRPPRRDQTLPRMHSASLLLHSGGCAPDVPPPRRNSSVDSPPPPPPPPATLPRRMPVGVDGIGDPFSRLGIGADRGGALRSASPGVSSLSARDHYRYRNHFNFNFDVPPSVSAPTAGPQLPPKPYRQSYPLSEHGGAP